MQLVSGFPPTSLLTLVNSWIEPSALLPPRVPTTLVHDLPTDPSRWKGRTIYLQAEPEVIIAQREFLLKNAHKFYAVLTFDEVVLRHCPNAVPYVWGGCWVHPPDRSRADPSTKEFRLSTLVGWKAQGAGHKLRQAIYSRQTEIPIPFTFYRSSHGRLLEELTTNPVYTDPSKYGLFDGIQFSLVIENSKQVNYFTEKLIDCLITKTVPIYWGCPNIGEFFFTEGMICLETDTVEEFLQKVSTLTPDTYARFLPMVEQNYQRALQYVRVEDNLNRAINRIPNY